MFAEKPFSRDAVDILFSSAVEKVHDVVERGRETLLEIIEPFLLLLRFRDGRWGKEGEGGTICRRVRG